MLCLLFRLFVLITLYVLYVQSVLQSLIVVLLYITLIIEQLNLNCAILNSKPNRGHTDDTCTSGCVRYGPISALFGTFYIE